MEKKKPRMEGQVAIGLPVPGPEYDPNWRVRQIEERLRVIEEYLSRTNFAPSSPGPIYAPPCLIDEI